MRVFITGATGWIGSVIVKELVEAGDQVTGLVRTKENGAKLTAMGATPLIGSLDNTDVLHKAAGDAEGVIHTAFGLDFSKIVEMSRQERAIIELFGEVYVGTARPIVATAGFGLLPRGEKFNEPDALRPIDPAFPRAPEHSTAMLTERGVHATVVRMPRSVHGRGETHGFIPMLAKVAREKGVSAYVADGENLWPAVHRLDAAHLFVLALKYGATGGPFHAASEGGIPFREIAETLGRQLGVPVRSLTGKEAEEHFGPLAQWVAGNGPVSSQRTRERLGWNPTKPGLLADLDHPDYFKLS